MVLPGHCSVPGHCGRASCGGQGPSAADTTEAEASVCRRCALVSADSFAIHADSADVDERRQEARRLILKCRSKEKARQHPRRLNHSLNLRCPELTQVVSLPGQRVTASRAAVEIRRRGRREEQSSGAP
eukprot:141855-Rhodomonas_salina.2